uniref:THAP-type domain-containing protein n=1 Tax=Oryzias latipes TaxID=8090 RepID=A0A3P9J7G5_ORYLA
MPTGCAHANCRNVVGKFRGVTFHKFPRDPEKLSRWTKFMKRHESWVPKYYDRVCSVHFSSEHFDRTGQTVRLRDNAEPSLPHLPWRFPKVTFINTKKEKQLFIHEQKTNNLPVRCHRLHCNVARAAFRQFHTYAGSNEDFKLKWQQAERRAETLSRKLRTITRTAMLLKKSISSLKEELKESSLLKERLQQKLDTVEGKLWRLELPASLSDDL